MQLNIPSQLELIKADFSTAHYAFVCCLIKQKTDVERAQLQISIQQKSIQQKSIQHISIQQKSIQQKSSQISRWGISEFFVSINCNAYSDPEILDDSKY